MADTIFQKRIYQLAEFIPLTEGEPGYENPSEIWLACDKLGWPEAKKMSLVQFVAALHKEQGPVEFSSVNVSHYYLNDFQDTNYYIEIKATRSYSFEGETFIENIPIRDFDKRVDGFSFVLENYQEGDSINFIAFE